MMNKCREEFERWREPQDIGTQWWTIWQGAWNARQPEVVAPTAQPNDSWLDKVIADDSLPPNHAVIDGKLVCYSRDPKVLVESLERIASYEDKLIGHYGARIAAVRLAREALAAWKGGQTEVVSGLNGCGFDKCPKCGGGLATFRHPGAKVNCANCGLVLQEEGGRKVYQPTPASSVPVPTVDELAIELYVADGYTRSLWDMESLGFRGEHLRRAKAVLRILTKGRGGVNG